jgi:hypothetical protein
MTATRTEPGGAHQLGHGLAIVWFRRVHVDDPELPVLVDLELDDNGDRLVVTTLTLSARLEGPPVDADALRSIPLARLVRRAIEGPLGGPVRVESTGDGSVVVTPPGPLSEVEAVAVAYKAALFIGEAPTAAVAEALGVSRDVAAKRVQAARRAGLLEPTSKGRKGA